MLFFQGPKFNSQHWHDGLQLSVIVAGDPMPSSGFCRPQLLTWYIDIHSGKQSIHIKIKVNRSIFKILASQLLLSECFTTAIGKKHKTEDGFYFFYHNSSFILPNFDRVCFVAFLWEFSQVFWYFSCIAILFIFLS